MLDDLGCAMTRRELRRFVAVEGTPPNICMDSCMILDHTYAQFGIRPEVRVVDLFVEQNSGCRQQPASPIPSCSGEHGNVSNGHAVPPGARAC
jgi:hypothetical protein